MRTVLGHGAPSRLMRRLAILATLLLLPVVAGHGAPPERSFESRLLHDCVDDYFGGDDGFGSNRDGYDIHTLDVREAWSSALGDHMVFRIILNGEGQSTITLSLTADGAAKSYTWTGSGTSWTGSFDKVTVIGTNVIQDGDRIALEGAVKNSKLGVSKGDALRDYSVVGSNGGDTHDSVPGDDSPALSSCDDSELYARPDYKLRGPVQYVDASFAERDVQVQAGQEKFVTLDLENILADAAQKVTVKLDGTDVRLHDPRTNDYVTMGSFDLDKRRSGGTAHQTFIHVAVEGAEAGDGTATATITTDLGGRITRTLEYTILAADETPTTTTTPAPTDAPDEESPGLGVLLLAALVAVALVRRQ